MHLLEVLSLSCCLAAGAVLLGPRQPAAAAAYESGQGYYEEEPDTGEAKVLIEPTEAFHINAFLYQQAHGSKDLEEQLRSVSSVDELMTVLYPEYWKMFKCQLRRGGWQHNREHASFDTRSDDSLKFAAAHYNAEILKSIDTEWRKTQCMPREVCVDVGKEFGATTNTFFKPPCVSIYRCGGCCNSEGLQCMNISTNYISKTLFEITVPLSHGPKPVTVSFANHTSCRCMSKLDVYRQVHSIIRRSLPAAQTQVMSVSKHHQQGVMWQTRPVQKIIFGIIKFADVYHSMILASLLTLEILTHLKDSISVDQTRSWMKKPVNVSAKEACDPRAVDLTKN
ncbi:vascular endothelial growth factor C isoform X1 [Turdus rufiventris]|nr:vascular endothelial growth factor C isoform X1 [Turdus rufiventris]